MTDRLTFMLTRNALDHSVAINLWAKHKMQLEAKNEVLSDACFLDHGYPANTNVIQRAKKILTNCLEEFEIKIEKGVATAPSIEVALNKPYVSKKKMKMEKDALAAFI